MIIMMMMMMTTTTIMIHINPYKSHHWPSFLMFHITIPITIFPEPAEKQTLGRGPPYCNRRRPKFEATKCQWHRTSAMLQLCPKKKSRDQPEWIGSANFGICWYVSEGRPGRTILMIPDDCRPTLTLTCSFFRPGLRTLTVQWCSQGVLRQMQYTEYAFWPSRCEIENLTVNW